MATMVTQRMMDNLSYMLLAKDDFQAIIQAPDAAPNNMQAQLDFELARENTLLRQQLLETSADHDAISKSLQERAQSLTDMTDAKIRAETEAKVLQVQLKSMQKDIDAHKYELHLLKKQLQIRNEETEHHKKASEASYKQHPDNVRKIARLESECQRLRGLIRQRVPGPAAIAKMRAECDIHVKMDIKKRSPPLATSSKNLPNSSRLQAQREIEGLKERLLSVEDEAKFLKEAMTKRTTELQEARQLCARTAMKLSAAQALVESMSTMDTAYSTPSTPMHPHERRVPFFNSDHLHAFHNQDNMSMLKSAGLIGENNGVYASPTMHGDVDDNGVIDVNSELDNDGHTYNSELDEVSCAKTWASALFAELSHLSNLPKNTLVLAETIGNRKQSTVETSKCKANVQELDIYSALEMVNLRLSSVGESILTSGLAVKEPANSLMNSEEDLNTIANLYDTNSTTHSAHKNIDILEEILQIKGLLLDIDRAMEMMGKRESADHFSKISCGYDNLECNEQLNVNQNAHEAFNRERGLSRLRYNSLEHGNESSAGGTRFSGESNKMEDMRTKFSKETDEVEDMGIKLSEQTDEMQDMGIKFKEDMSAKRSGESDEAEDKGIKLNEQTDEMQDIAIQFKEETDEMEEAATKFSEQTKYVMEDMGTKLVERTEMSTTSSGDVCICIGGNTAATAILEQRNAAGTASCGQLNLAVLAAAHQVGREESDIASDLEADVQLEEKLHAAQAELDLARGQIAKLEAELARSLQEKADVVNELSDTRSLKQSLQAELAGALASMEDLKLQLSALQLSQVDQATCGATNVSPFKIRPPTLAHLDVHANMNEEQELAGARAQLADCQRSIHEIRKQMVNEIQHEALQDVISDEQLLFDTCSESSKSLDQSSQLPSPIIDNTTSFAMSASKIVIAKTIEDALTQQECETVHFSTPSRSHTLYEDSNFEQVILKEGHATTEEQHCIEECKDLEPSNKHKQFVHIFRTPIKDRVNKSTQQTPNLLGSSTTSRIAEFFGRAKLSTRGS